MADHEMQPSPPGPPEREAEEPGLGQIMAAERAKFAKVVLGLAVLVIFIVFIVQNSDEVDVDFVFFSSRIALIWVFLGCALIGALATWLLGRPRRRALKRMLQKAQGKEAPRRNP
ncbi:MAG: LapA family protein [Actinomycetota bacterium]